MAMIQKPVGAIDPDKRLASLGLDREVLVDAVLHGELHRSACTDHDPIILPGMLAWAKTVGALRDLLVSRGWRPVQVDGAELVVNDEAKIAIRVLTGDDDTGVVEGVPTTRHAKGRSTARAIATNLRQLEFGFMDTDSEAGGVTTWVLLVSRQEQQLRVELSLATSVDCSGRPCDWVERIILDPINTAERLEVSANGDVGEEIDVPVTKRS